MIPAPVRSDGKADPRQTKQVQELKHDSPLIACRLDPTGRFAVASAQDNTLQRWELAGGKKTPLAGHQSWVRALAFHPAEPVLFAGDYQGRVLAWPVADASPRPARSWQAHRGWVRAVATSPDGSLLATCGNDHLVKLWSAGGGKPVRELRGHDCHVYHVAFHPGGQFLVSADLKGRVRHWDVGSGKQVRELDAAVLHKYDGTFRADIGGIRGIAFDPAGTLLACSGITDVSNAFAGVGKPLVVLFDWQGGKRKQLLKPKEAFQGTAWGVAFHPDGFLVGVGGGSGGAVWFWKPEAADSFHTVKLPANGRDLSLHPDGKRFAVATADGAVRVFAMAGGAKT